jgi:putative colanic acid biosysnthesis UDP-glucose lipid carrier transferase
MIQPRNDWNCSAKTEPSSARGNRVAGSGIPSHPAFSLQYRIVKRLLDVVLSAVVLVLATPLMLLIALAVKCSSRGPVLFRQRRVGLNGQLLWMVKFRTMRTSPPAVSDRRWTRPRDRRVTPLGRILRQTGLDELPQLVNVLKGDMSLVGPRPERPHFVECFKNELPDYWQRHTVHCGITGWAQVNGWRGDTSIQKRLEHDLYYVRNWTLAFDLKILWITLARGFRHPNAC